MTFLLLGRLREFAKRENKNPRKMGDECTDSSGHRKADYRGLRMLKRGKNVVTSKGIQVGIECK